MGDIVGFTFKQRLLENIKEAMMEDDTVGMAYVIVHEDEDGSYDYDMNVTALKENGTVSVLLLRGAIALLEDFARDP